MKLKYKFAIYIIIVGIILIVSVSAFYNYYFRDSRIQEEFVNTKKITENFTLQFDSELEAIINNVVTLASAPVIKQHLFESNSHYNSLTNHNRNQEIDNLNHKWKETTEISDPFIQKYMNNPTADFFKIQQKNNPNFYGEIFLTNRYGVMVSTTNKLTTLAHSYKYWWEASYNKGEGRIFLDDRGFDTSVKGYVLGVVVPVKDNNQIIGILKCNINIIDLLSGITKKYNKLYEHGQLKVVRTGGSIVYASGVPPLTTKVSADIINFLAEKEVSAKIKDDSGENSIIGISTIKSTIDTDRISFGGSYESEDHLKGNQGENWHILRTISNKEVLNEFNEKNIIFIYSGLIFILLSAIISYIFGDKLSKPIVRISAEAKKIGEGDLKNKIKIVRNDEIGVLANTINQMTNNLKNTVVSKTRLEKILQTTQDGFWMVNLKGEIIDVNQAYIDMTGYSRNELLGMKISELEVIENEIVVKNKIQEIKKMGQKLFESKHQTKNNEIIDVEVSSSFIETKDPFIVVFIRDITERKKADKKMMYLSFHDKMTGLYNRRYFENELERLNNSRHYPITIIIGDLDGLKFINDNYGHKKGDEYIINTADILKSTVRKDDIIARIGGDEFAIILPSTNYKEAKSFCCRIQKNIAEFNKRQSIVKPLSISLGFEVMETREQNLDEVFIKADQKMYMNKGRK